MAKVYRFHLFDAPPVYFQQYGEARMPNGQLAKDLRPVYLGELRGVSKWHISEEINNLNVSAEITFNPSRITEKDTYIRWFLSQDEKFIQTSSGDRIEVNRQRISKVAEKRFEDTRITYGKFVQIESYNNKDNKREILFHGYIQNWEADSQANQYVLRCMSISELAGADIAFQIFENSNSGYRITRTNPDGSRTNVIYARSQAGTQDTRDDFITLAVPADGQSDIIKNTDLATKFVDWRFYFRDPVRIMYWLWYRSVYLKPGRIYSANGRVGTWASGGTIGGTHPADITMSSQTVNELTQECMEFLPEHWFLRINYDTDNNVADDYIDRAYRPVIDLVENKIDTSSLHLVYEADYTVKADKHVIS